MIEGLFVLLLVVVVLAVPVVVTLLAKGSEAKRKERELTRHLTELEWRLYNVEQYLRREAEAERAPATTTAAEPAPPPPPPAAQPSTPPEIQAAAPALAPSAIPPEPAPAESAPRSAQPRRPTPESPFEPAAPSPAKSLDWESLIGVRLFAWLGGIALFLGGAFFLQYSIQHELIAPPVRVALGLGVGALALFGGDRLRSRASWAAEALSGAGIAILYSALFSAHSLYHLIDSGPTFAAMALVTLTAGMLAVKRGAFVVALLGLLGGMATPYLLSTGEDRPLSLFAYIALLGVGVVVVSSLRGWPWLSLIGVLGSAVIFGGWSDRYLTDARVPYALLAQALVFGLYGYAESRRASRPGALGSVVAVLTVVAPLGFVVAFCSSNELEPKPWFLVGYLLVLSAGALLVDARRKLPGLVAATALLGVAALVARADASLFPAEQTSTLLAFALFPLAYAAWAFVRAKHVPAGRWARFAASLALFGALPIVWRALDALPREASVLGLFAFAAVHAALLVALAAQARSGVLQVFAQVLALVVVSVLLDRYDSAHPGLYAALIAASGACFWVAPLAHERLRGDVWAWLSGALALPAHFLLAYGVLHGDVSNGVLGMAAVVCSALALGSLAVQRKQGVVIDKPSSRLSALLGAIVLGFISSAVPILLSNEWITVSWALIAGALCWLYRRLPHRGLLVAIGVLGAAVCVRLLANPALWEYHERSGVRILNFYLYTFGVPAVSFLLGAHLLAQTKEPARPEPAWLAALLRVAAIGFAFFLLNVEVADYFSTGSALTFHLSDGSLSEDMTYSLAWGAFALILLTIGIARDIINLRVGAILFLTLTLLKVTLHDLWALGGLYRVGSLLGVAFALLLVSFLTQRLVLKKGARMKRGVLWLALAASALAGGAAAAEAEQPPRFSRVISCQPGWASLELTPEVLDVAQADLGDLRIVGPDGDVPYALEDQLNALPDALAFFDVESTPGRETVALIDRGLRPPLLSCVSINAAGEEPFLKPVVIEASADRVQFRKLATASVFRVAGRAQTSLCFPQSDQRYLRFRFDDRNSAPIQPLTLGTPLSSGPPEQHVLPVTLEQASGAEADAYSYLLKLPSHRLPARSLALTVSDPAFSRVVNVSERILFRDEMSLRLVGSARIERTPSGEAQLNLPLGQLSASTLVLEVEKAGPPLHVEHAELTVGSRSLLFLAPAGALSLRYGGEHLRPPPSDVREVLRKSRPAHFASATLGALIEEPAKSTPSPLRGPPVDPKAFASARELTLPASGRTAYIDVDGEVASSLASLRIVDAAGRQVPYVVERRERTRKVPLALKVSRSDAKTVATISGLDPKQRVRALELSGNGPEFYTRPVQLFETVRDKRGVVERRVVGEGSWLRRPGDPPQNLDLPMTSDASELELEIDNGDNPPLVPTQVLAFVESTRLDFSFVQGDKFTLLAKNPSLPAPRYDLELIAATLIDSPGSAATLGPERATSASTSPATPVWFWPAAAAALALVVIVLLRSMLAKSEPGQ